jgi:hypothetical protein
MSKNARYHVIPDGASYGVLIFDSQTGAIQRPECWQDLAAYYSYLVGRGQIYASQQLLAESMAGNKPITKMLMSVAPTKLSVSCPACCI